MTPDLLTTATYADPPTERRRWENVEREYDTPAWRGIGIRLARYMPEHLIGLCGPNGMVLLNKNTGKISFCDWMKP